MVCSLIFVDLKAFKDQQRMGKVWYICDVVWMNFSFSLLCFTSKIGYLMTRCFILPEGHKKLPVQSDLPGSQSLLSLPYQESLIWSP